jgi:phospholipase C
LFAGLESGSLPNVVFVDGGLNSEDDHPPADIKRGERWTKDIYDAAVKSPLWRKTAIFFTYDEAGGFFDHVAPPPYDAEKSKVCVARPEDAEFHELGIRVPLVVISPWARRQYVSHVRHEHTSMTRFIELVFGLSALTARDANSDALLDMFDFECENTAPLPAPPEIGDAG